MEFERILLTGGGGFVGSHILSPLADAFPKARRVAITRGCERLIDPRWTSASVDLLDADMLDSFVGELEPDLVVHLAGQASVGQALNARAETWRVNFNGSFNLAEALARHAPRVTVLFASSATVYGATLRQGVVDENAAVFPLDAYSRSKTAAELAFADVLSPTSKLIVARPVNHSGPRQSEDFVLPSFVAQIAAIEAGRREPRLVIGDLSKERDFLDVRDVVDAYVRLATAAPQMKQRLNVYNIGSGEARSLRSLLDRLKSFAETSFAEVVDEQLLRPSQSDLRSIAVDASRMRALGWAPTHTIDDMLRSMLDHARRIETAPPREAIAE